MLNFTFVPLNDTFKQQDRHIIVIQRYDITLD
ncbi:hypothetical protein CCDG5_1663 [[Clostridium] cellulosi]|uniref:Uncharacterized protein n=1 Tax=[Clostridium] cellulosi TaxID=29343 RepID=A0A078KM20_9FIRM|nr:hypothetical protein CCDG5_1663 [[Clostridium] cellulosi]